VAHDLQSTANMAKYLIVYAIGVTAGLLGLIYFINRAL
jgi:hypothetical protein